MPARVVVKFSPGADLRQAPGEPVAALAERAVGARWLGMSERFGGAQMRRHLDDVPRRAASAPTGLERYLVAELSERDRAEALAAELRDLPQVETAYVEAGPVPPPVQAADDPRSANQGYLDAAPAGIDARWAWSATDGHGIGFVDLERGWTLDHEDLVDAGITVISGLNKDYPGHGTAVLGEVVAVDNTRGGIGIAPGARARVVSQWRTPTTYDTAAAIASAAAVMSAGDVLLLEAQTIVGAQTNVPVETEQAAFDAIKAAVAAGIIVVEAGGNGGLDLDTVTDPAGKRVFDPTSSDHRDSGAIMVGAASAAVPHTRLGFSNYGDRIDCFAWGESIDTTGDGWTGTSTSAYTGVFGGTSGASPIVAGAAVLLQSWALQARGRRYPPSVVRGLLSEAVVNTASAEPTKDRIGVMPNLRAVLESQRPNPFDPRRWQLLLQIIFGITQDGGGLGLKPGGPVPVGPWGPLARLSAGKRDILTMMAISELGSFLDDAEAREALDAAVGASLRRAGDRRL